MLRSGLADTSVFSCFYVLTVMNRDEGGLGETRYLDLQGDLICFLSPHCMSIVCNVVVNDNDGTCTFLGSLSIRAINGLNC